MNKNELNKLVMKKLAILAVASVVSLSVSAQDVCKQISNTKDYKEAYNLLQSNLSNLSAEQKAKCYNALVDLAYGKVVKEQGIKTSNQMAEQLKTKVEPYDTVGLYNATCNALECGVACDEFDKQPNDKGKVKPKFHKSNGDRLYAIRFHLIDGGIYYQNKDEAKAYKMLATYVDSNDYPLFGEQDKTKDAATVAQMAFYASRFAYFAKEYDKAEKYADIAMKDAEAAKDALQLKLAVMQTQLKSHADTLNYVSKLKDIYVKDESNEMIFSTICSMLISLNDKASLDGFISDKLAKDPDNFTALAMKGQSFMNEHKWDEAIETLNKATSVQPNNVAVIASLGNCYMYKAQEAAERASANGKRISPNTEKVIVDVYNQAISYLEKARDLDTKLEFKHVWAYSLYTCCYRVYGVDDAKTKDAETYTK